jgi:hypothetical protein
MPKLNLRPLLPMTPDRIALFWSFVEKTEGCWLWKGQKGSFGYGVFSISADDRKHSTRRLAHRIAYMLAHNIDPMTEPIRQNVLHSCDTPACVRDSHLFLGTLADNNRDREQKGRTYRVKLEEHARGEHAGFVKLTEQQVREIRQRYSEGTASGPQLARDYHVGNTIIYHIIHRQWWRHIL